MARLSFVKERMWALRRDGEIFLIRPKKYQAESDKQYYGLNGESKHKWTIVAVQVRCETN